jgi:hypothetical protein
MLCGSDQSAAGVTPSQLTLEKQQMFDWLKRKRTTHKLPEYSAIRQQPCRKLPSDLAAQEADPAHRARQDALQDWLLQSSRRPPADSPLFVEIVCREQGFLTIQSPQGSSHCLPVFGSPFHAGDYVRTLVDPSLSINYLVSSPLQIVGLLRDGMAVNISHFTLDRCPRCDTYCAIESASITTVDKALDCWAICKAIQLARLDLYLTYAQTAAQAGDLYTARDVLLETAGHVSFEEPRVHVLLGEVAAALDDRELFKESKAFLKFLQFNPSEQ